MGGGGVRADGVRVGRTEPGPGQADVAGDIHNGLALTRNVHWAFDRGLWSVDDQFRILIKPERFQEWGPDDLGLTTYRGRMLQFAPQATLRPRSEYFRRHRQQWGFS